MNRLNKTALAIGFSLIGVVSSVSALVIASDSEQQFREIKVKAGDAANVDVYVNADGYVTNLSLPKVTLKDKDKLAQALEQVPEDVREQLVNALTGIHLEEKLIKVHAGEGFERHLTWAGEGDAEHVIVVKEIDGDVDSDQIKQVVKEIVIGGDDQLVKLEHKGTYLTKSVKRLLEHGKFSQEQLDEIQQALDAKR